MKFYTIEEQSDNSYQLYKNEGSTKTLMSTPEDFDACIQDYIDDTNLPFYLIPYDDNTNKNKIIASLACIMGSDIARKTLSMYGTYVKWNSFTTYSIEYYYIYLYGGYPGQTTPTLTIKKGSAKLVDTLELSLDYENIGEDNKYSVKTVHKGPDTITDLNESITLNPDTTQISLNLIRSSTGNRDIISYTPLKIYYTFSSSGFHRTCILWGSYYNGQDNKLYQVISDPINIANGFNLIPNQLKFTISPLIPSSTETV